MFGLGLAAALAAEQPAQAASAGAPLRTAAVEPPAARLTSTQMFRLANRAEKAGKVALAEEVYRALQGDPNEEVRLEATFRRGLLMAGSGRIRQAAVLLRRVIDARPGAQRARLELASMLVRLGDDQGARRELRAARAGSLPPEVARLVDRWSETLRARKPFGVTVEVAMAPDTNINRATRSDTLDTILGDLEIASDGKARSGMGIAMNALSYRRIGLASGVSLVGKLSGSANLYKDGDYNLIGVEAIVGPEFDLAGTRVAIEAGAGQSWFGGEPSTRQFRVSAIGRRPLGPRTTATVRASLTRIDNRLNALQDGRALSLGLSAEHALSNRSGLALSLSGERFGARDPGYSTRSWRVGLQGWRDVGRATLFGGAEVGRLGADERLLLFPEARRDKYFRVNAGAVLRSLTVLDLAPFVRISRERNRSNIAFYDYARARTEFGFSRAF